jgi:hypothetical protein
MQDTQALPHWAFTVLQTLATLGAGGVILKLIELYLNRKKPIVEVQKAEAETTEITIRSHSTAGDSMIRMMNRLEDALKTNDRLRDERDTANAERDNAHFELREEKAKSANLEDQRKVAEHYIKRLGAAIELGVTLEQLDKIKPPSEKAETKFVKGDG